jgi:hypothetical protein
VFSWLGRMATENDPNLDINQNPMLHVKRSWGIHQNGKLIPILSVASTLFLPFKLLLQKTDLYILIGKLLMLHNFIIVTFFPHILICDVIIKSDKRKKVYLLLQI